MQDQFNHVMIDNPDQHSYKYFDGKDWKVSESNTTVEVYTPTDGTVLGRIQAVTSHEVDQIIEVAKTTQREWESVPIVERMKKISFAAKLIRHYKDDLINLLVLEIGKTKEDAKNEVLRTADLVEYFASEAQSLTGDFIAGDTFPGYTKGRYAMVERVAHGVVAAIGPFNYPLNLTASKIAPALVMGNAVIFKPPTQGSISGLWLTKLFIDAGLPFGLLSCVTGSGKEIGNHLSGHPGISMIAFTGSSAVGKMISERAGMKPLLFECGGNNGVIIDKAAELETTAAEIIKGAFAFSGQRCTGIKYVLATDSVMNELLVLLAKKVPEMIHVGDPRQDETLLVGPLINEESAQETEKAIHEALEAGAQLVTGGERNGRYVTPTILKQVKADMRCVHEEIFGPILSCIVVQDLDEAVQIINNSEYGLQTSIFSQDEGAAIALAKKIQIGTVQINGSPQRGPDHFPFMGIKASGLGVQGVRYSLEAMSRLKSTVLNNPS